MKKFLNLGLLALSISLMLSTTSCTTVDTGHEAAVISWGGQTDMASTLSEGVHWGVSYLVNSTEEYNVREQTYTYEISLNDRNDMVTPVQVVVYYQPQKGKVNKLHSLVGPDYKDEKLKSFVASVVGKVIPQYTAQEINKTKRAEVEKKLTQLLDQEAKAIYVNVPRVNFTKVGIPAEVARIAEQIATQLSRNELATKKEAEQTALAKAKVATAQGDYDAGVLNAKTQDLLSQPKMLERQRIENEKLMWEGFKAHGKSPFGNNNYFGVGAGGSNPLVMIQKP